MMTTKTKFSTNHHRLTVRQVHEIGSFVYFICLPILIAIGLFTAVPPLLFHLDFLLAKPWFPPLYGPFVEQLSVLQIKVYWTTQFHRLCGAIYALTGAWQFHPRLRQQYPAIHRWSGRVFLVTAATTGLSGAFLGVKTPYAGVAESVPAVLFGLLVVLSGIQAYRSIMAKDITGHRDWALRTYALGLGVETVRVVYGIVTPIVHAFELLDPQSKEDDHKLFVGSFWIGWLINIAAAETWISWRRQETSLVKQI